MCASLFPSHFLCIAIVCAVLAVYRLVTPTCPPPPLLPGMFNSRTISGAPPSVADITAPCVFVVLRYGGEGVQKHEHTVYTRKHSHVQQLSSAVLSHANL